MTSKEYNEQFSEEELSNEIWKDVLGYEGYYQVSNLGRVKSLERYKKNHSKLQRVKEKILKVYRAGKCYIVVGLSMGFGIKVLYVHRLVLSAFVGSCPEGMEACHIDGNKYNNRVENLRWDTHRENLHDKIKHGTHNRGEKSSNAKLKYTDVLKIRYLYKTGKYFQGELGVMFNTSRSNINLIINNKHWQYAPD